MSIEAAAAAVVEALGEPDCEYAEPSVEHLMAQLSAPISTEAARGLRAAVGELRGHRCFSLMKQLCDRIAEVAEGPLRVYAWRQWSQAQIELGHYDSAMQRLHEALGDAKARHSEKEQSETLGLLGRTAKQLFVRANESGDSTAAERHLVASVEYYGEAFPLDPAWHGANLVALKARAERDQVLVHGPSAEEWAARLLEALYDRGEDEWGPWDAAGAAEAFLAKRDLENAAKYFARYWNAPNVSQFALAGTERQLKEIWQVGHDTADDFLRSLLVHLDAKKIDVLTAADATPESLRYEPWQLRDLAARISAGRGTAEALFGKASTVPLDRVLSLLRQSQSVCRVMDPDEELSGGTGFLVDGKGLSAMHSGRVLLLTNHHVLHDDQASDALLEHDDYVGSVHVERARAIFHYWDGKATKKQFAVDELVSFSPRSDLDFALASLKDAELTPDFTVKLSETDRPLQSRNFVKTERRSKVFLVGHPRGGKLSFSLSDNEVVDHELDGAPVAMGEPRRIHYRAPTESGSSGSPVFEHKRVEVVGLHRTGSVAPLRDPWPGKKEGDAYEANEAVSIRSIREFLSS